MMFKKYFVFGEEVYQPTPMTELSPLTNFYDGSPWAKFHD